MLKHVSQTLFATVTFQNPLEKQLCNDKASYFKLKSILCCFNINNTNVEFQKDEFAAKKKLISPKIKGVKTRLILRVSEMKSARAKVCEKHNLIMESRLECV